jgi:hypothetical protein
MSLKVVRKNYFFAQHHEDSPQDRTHLQASAGRIYDLQRTDHRCHPFRQGIQTLTKKLYLQLEEVVSGFILKF